MKRIIAACIAAVLLCPAASAQGSAPPELSAECAILMDAESGRVLFEKSAHEPRAIASITKLMTALVAAEHISDIQEQVTIQPQWTGIEGSSIYLRPGETVTVETLLYGLLLNSGNDAAVALAGYCAGSVEAFADRMNSRAWELGMTQTHFANPNGLSEEDHYSTACDMALAARACWSNETVAKIVAAKTATLEGRTFTNHNKLLWRYDGCIGFKTGYTEAAGRTLVSGACRNGQTLIAVTLNAPDDWADHAALLDYGFANYQSKTLCKAGERIGLSAVSGGLVPCVPLVTGKAVRYPLTGDEQAEARIAVREQIPAPVAAGDVLGSLSFYLDDQLIGQTELTAASGVKSDAVDGRRSLRRLWDRLWNRE